MSARRTLLRTLDPVRSHARPPLAASGWRVVGAASFSSQPPPPSDGPAEHASSDTRRRAIDYVKDPIAWTLLAGLVIAGGLTAYGLEFYKLTKVWPDDVRQPLKKAQRALDADDYIKAERFFTEALNIARARQPSLPLLHTTGLASVLAHVQAECQHAPQRAYQTLVGALQELDANGPALTGAEKLRRLGVLNKLAEIAGRLGKEPQEEEYAGRAVTEVLRESAARRRLLGARRAKEGSQGLEPAEPVQEQERSEEEMELDDLLPVWLNKTQLGATIDYLAGLYLKKGKADYAAPLYLHAINVVLPPTDSSTDPSASGTSVEDQCRAAMMMSNLSSTLSLKPSKFNLEAAHTWASRSLETIERVLVTQPEFSIGAARKTAEDEQTGPGPKLLGRWWMKKGDLEKERAGIEREELERREMCESVRSVALFNLGLLAEMNGDEKKALEQLKESLKWSAEVGFVEGVRQATGALERIDAKPPSKAG